MIPPRATPRRGEPSPAEKQAARERCCERAQGICDFHTHDGEEIMGIRIEKSPRCLAGPLPLEGDLFTRGHLAHLRTKRVHGWMESAGQRHLYACFECHHWQHIGGKPIPKK